MEKDKVSIEEAIDRAGFGLYSYLMIGLAGLSIISFACIGYGSTILVPTSACELDTTPSQQGLLAAGPVVGSIIGVVIWGYLADTRGRRSMLLAALVGGSLVNCLASISVNWVMLLALQFAASLFASGLYSMSMALLSESVPMARRNLVVLLVTSIFMLSQGIMAVLAIPVIPLRFSIYLEALGIYWNSWRTLVIVYSTPGFLAALWLLLMKESPKFEHSQGREEEALRILKTIHRVNNLCTPKDLPVSSILKEEVKLTEQGEVEVQQSPIRQLFSKPLLKYTIIMTVLLMFQQVGAFLVWLPTIANQFINIMQTGEGSNLALCYIIRLSLDAPIDPEADPCGLQLTAMLMVLGVGVLQSLINLVLSLIVNFTGRRNIVFGLAAVCGLAGILVNLVPSAVGSAVLYAVMLQGILVLGMYTAIIVALFPTQLRSLAIAIPLMGGRMVTFASIQILNIMLINNCEAGFYLFASIFASSGLVAALLPDDRRLRPASPASPAPAPPAAMHSHPDDRRLRPASPASPAPAPPAAMHSHPDDRRLRPASPASPAPAPPAAMHSHPDDRRLRPASPASPAPAPPAAMHSHPDKKDHFRDVDDL